jgi:hypothetical protein
LINFCSFQGVSNLVGDAVAMKRSFVNSMPVIGVNSWGAVYDNHVLIEEGEDQVLINFIDFTEL